MLEPHIQLNLMGVGSPPEPSAIATEEDQTTATARKPLLWKWWIQISVYTFLVLAGQSAALILGRVYFNQGGKSTWMSTLVQVVGFPALLPLYYVLPKPPKSRQRDQPKLKIWVVYTSFGLLVALDSWLYSIGLMYLPVSTYSLIWASQLAFNVLFAFLRTHNFTPYIVNSVVILTVSSTLLVFQNETSTTDGTPVSKAKYILGFLCTVGASAIYGLLLPLTQIAFQRVLKRDDFLIWTSSKRDSHVQYYSSSKRNSPVGSGSDRPSAAREPREAAGVLCGPN